MFKDEKLAKHKELADKIKESLQREAGMITEREDRGAYLANLPEGINKEVVDTLSKYNNGYTVAAHVAIGEMAAEAFKADKKLDRIDSKLTVGGVRDTMEVTVHREKTFKNSFAKTPEEETIHKSLVMTTKIQSNTTGLKSIMKAMSEEFKAHHG